MQKVTKEKTIYDTAPLIAVTNILQSNYFTIPTFSHTYTHNHPSLPPCFLLTSLSFILDHYRRRGRKRENERKQKRERGGQVLVVTTALPPPLLSGLCSDVYPQCPLYVHSTQSYEIYISLQYLLLSMCLP